MDQPTTTTQTVTEADCVAFVRAQATALDCRHLLLTYTREGLVQRALWSLFDDRLGRACQSICAHTLAELRTMLAEYDPAEVARRELAAARTRVAELEAKLGEGRAQ